MPIEEGTITKVENNRAWVTVRRSTMCDECHSKGACHTLGGGKDMEALAYNTAEGKVGDRVLIKIRRKSLLRMTFLVYMLPVIAMVGGAFAGRDIGPRYAIEPELASVITSFSALLISVIIIKIFGNYIKGRRDYMPEITKVLPSYEFILGKNNSQ